MTAIRRNSLLSSASFPKSQELEYLESSGLQGIITDIVPSSDLEVQAELEFSRFNSPTLSTILGRGTQYDVNILCFKYYEPDNRYYVLSSYNKQLCTSVMGTGQMSNRFVTYELNKRIKIDYNNIDGNEVVEYNGRVYTYSCYRNISTTTSIARLGCFNVFASIYHPDIIPDKTNIANSEGIAFRLYYLKGLNRNTGEVLWYYKPYLDENGKPCLYDIINNKYNYDYYWECCDEQRAIEFGVTYRPDITPYEFGYKTLSGEVVDPEFIIPWSEVPLT